MRNLSKIERKLLKISLLEQSLRNSWYNAWKRLKALIELYKEVGREEEAEYYYKKYWDGDYDGRLHRESPTYNLVDKYNLSPREKAELVYELYKEYTIDLTEGWEEEVREELNKII